MEIDTVGYVEWREVSANTQQRIFGARTEEIGDCLSRTESADVAASLAAPDGGPHPTVDTSAYAFTYRGGTWKVVVITSAGLDELVPRLEPEALGRFVARWGVWSSGVVLSVRRMQPTWLSSGPQHLEGVWVHQPEALPLERAGWAQNDAAAMTVALAAIDAHIEAN